MVKPGSQGSAQLLLSKSQLLRDVPAFLKAHLLPSLSPWIITDTPPPGRQTRSAAQIKEQFGSKLLPFLSLSHPFKSELPPLLCFPTFFPVPRSNLQVQITYLYLSQGLFLRGLKRRTQMNSYGCSFDIPSIPLRCLLLKCRILDLGGIW